MHAGELPVGNHSFRLVAYGEGKTQVSELPQTLRGRSKEATSAASELMHMAKAMALMLNNTQQMFALQHQEFEAQQKRLGDQYENVALLIDRNAENASNNLEAQLRLEQFHNEQSRRDKREEAMLSIITPIGVMAMEKYGPKLLSMTPGEIEGKVKEMFKGGTELVANSEPAPEVIAPPEAAPQVAPETEPVTITRGDLAQIAALLQGLVVRIEHLEQTTAQVGKEGPPDESTSNTAVESVRSSGLQVSQPGPERVQRNNEAGSKGSARSDIASRGQQAAHGTRLPTNHQKARRVTP